MSFDDFYKTLAQVSNNHVTSDCQICCDIELPKAPVLDSQTVYTAMKMNMWQLVNVVLDGTCFFSSRLIISKTSLERAFSVMAACICRFGRHC
jgi:hypothetical protein